MNRKVLSKNEMALIVGSNASTCTATCANGKSVTCSGNNCVSSDDIGCESDNGKRDCPTELGGQPIAGFFN